MNQHTFSSERRDALKSGGGLGVLALLAAAGWLKPGMAAAEAGKEWNTAAFESKSLPEALKALGNIEPMPSTDIVFFQTPEIAENGAVVPVGVTSNIPGTTSIALLVEKNPNTLAAIFDIPAGTDPTILTRIKMGQSSNIIALVAAVGKYYVATKDVKVTLGGCGG